MHDKHSMVSNDEKNIQADADADMIKSIPTCAAQSRSSIVWLAEMQTRARADRRGVAGKPTTTSAMPRSSSSRDVEQILPG